MMLNTAVNAAETHYVPTAAERPVWAPEPAAPSRVTGDLRRVAFSLVSVVYLRVFSCIGSVFQGVRGKACSY